MQAAVDDHRNDGTGPSRLARAFKHEGRPEDAHAVAACAGLTIVRRRMLHGAVLSDVLAPADGVSEWHVHTGAIMVAVLTGCLVAHTSAGDAVWNAGSVQVQPGGQRHRLRAGPVAVRAMVVELSDRWSSRLAIDGAAIGPGASQQAFIPAMRLYHELTSWTVSSQLTAEGIVLGMLGGIARREKRRIPREEPTWLATAEAYVRRNLRHAVSVTDVAAAVGIDPAHLSRTWQRYRGGSVAESLRRTRVEVSCCRMAAGAVALSDLARDLGFADQTHLTRAFKQVAGMTPGDFRAALAIPRGAPRCPEARTRGEGQVRVADGIREPSDGCRSPAAVVA